jgi:hypothetical protein
MSAQALELTTTTGIRLRLQPDAAGLVLDSHLITSTVLTPFPVRLTWAQCGLLADLLARLEAGQVGPATVRHYLDTPPDVALVLDLSDGERRGRHNHLFAEEARQLAALLRKAG